MSRPKIAMLKWTPSLATGSTEIDEQHKELFNRVNIFLESCQSGKGNDDILTTLSFLEQYVEEHFCMEESYMHSFGFPEEDMHRAQHNFFRREIGRIRKRVEEGAVREQLLDKIRTVLVGWLLNHVQVVDKALGE